MKNLLILFLLVLLVSCTNKEEIDLSKPISIQLESRSYDFQNLGFEFGNYWNCAFENFTMPVVCGCTCDDIDQIETIYNHCKNELSLDFTDEWKDEYSCETLRYMVRSTCLFEDYDEFKTKLNHTFSLLPQISDEEQQIFSNILSMDFRNSFNVESLREQWYELPENEYTDNQISLIAIEVVNSVHQYYTDNKGTIDNDPDCK